MNDEAQLLSMAVAWGSLYALIWSLASHSSNSGFCAHEAVRNHL